MNTLPYLFDYISLRELILYSLELLLFIWIIFLVVKNSKKKKETKLQTEYWEKIKQENFSVRERIKKNGEEHEKEIKELVEKYNSLYAENARLQNKVQAALDEIKEINLMNERGRINDLKETSKLNTEIENLNAINKKLGDTIQRLELEIKNSNNERQNLVKINSKFANEIKDLVCSRNNKLNKPKKSQRKKRA